jgi:hypothetical protein
MPRHDTHSWTARQHSDSDFVADGKGCARSVGHFLRDDQARLDELLAEAQALTGEGYLAAAQVAFECFALRLDRHLRLQTRGLLPTPRPRRAWSSLCATATQLRAGVATVEAAGHDATAFAEALLALDLLLGRYVSQEQRLLATNA